MKQWLIIFSIYSLQVFSFFRIIKIDDQEVVVYYPIPFKRPFRVPLNDISVIFIKRNIKNNLFITFKTKTTDVKILCFLFRFETRKLHDQLVSKDIDVDTFGIFENDWKR